MRKFFPLLFLCLLGRFAVGQKTTVYLDPDREYRAGLELFDKKKYGAAMKSFQNIIEAHRNSKSLVRIDAEFYAAACAIELVNKDGEWRMKKFIGSHPESNRVMTAYFYLGKSNFRKKKYPATLEYLEKVDVGELDKNDAHELKFKRGYSYLQAGQPEKAKNDLYDIKDIDNKYARPANYYYSHIAYTEKNYSTALEGFNRLLEDETFGSVAPYYIAQIYFLQGKYDEVIKVAPPLLHDSIQAQKSSEINRIIGQSYFYKKQYAEAIPFLLKGPVSSAQDNYQMGYAYFNTGDVKSATPYFEKAVGGDDSLSQNAFYYLADCYMRQGDKNKARGAYFSAYNLAFDKQIREESLLNYAKLCYETGFSPFNDAIKYFQLYIREYPQSVYKDEAYRYLVNCFQSTKNYAAAMRMIEEMNTEDPNLRQVYQQLCYFRAVNHFNNNQADSARKYFNNALRLNVEPSLSALSRYWLAELSYQGKAYNNAIESWEIFQEMPGSINLKEYDLANYNIGYALFMNKNYEEAGISFRKYLMGKKLDDALSASDANVRTGDCYFMQKNFASAAEYYETAVALGKIDVDYALYQKALCNGLLKNYKEKIGDLQMLQDKFPSSPYIVSAVFETAESYKLANETDNAIKWYDKVIANYPASPYVTRATKTAGFLYYNQNNYDKAFKYLDKIVKQNPKSEEAKDAIETIKKIFKEQNKPEEMESYLASIGTSASVSELDESYWEKASDLYYNKKDCEAALPELQKYIAKFPDGKYINEAHFCFAECAYSKGDFAAALPSYQFVIGKPRSIHTEIALAKASYLLYRDKKYAEALPLYMQLQEAAETSQNKLAAKLGAMRCAYQVKQFEQCVNECNKVLNTEKLSANQLTEAHLLKARSLYELNRRDEALADLNWLVKNAKSEAGAEAYYYLAMIRFGKKEFKQAEKTVNALVGYPYSNNDWNTKGMLLMADVYMERKEYANAEAVLQSVIENADKAGYIDLARQKLQEVRDRQNARTGAAPGGEAGGGEMQIEFKNKGADVMLEPGTGPDTLKTAPK